MDPGSKQSGQGQRKKPGKARVTKKQHSYILTELLLVLLSYNQGHDSFGRISDPSFCADQWVPV
jgi:hypothetical protein